MGQRFVACDREQSFLMPPDVREWLPSRHLAWFVIDAVAEMDLECCISHRGSRWPDPAKPFFFRAPPAAAERLAEIGVDCVTLANNHALDYGAQALLDTLGHLSAVGIACVGAGPDVEHARAPARLSAGSTRLAAVGVSDHPAAFAAGPAEPGIAERTCAKPASVGSRTPWRTRGAARTRCSSARTGVLT